MHSYLFKLRQNSLQYCCPAWGSGYTFRKLHAVLTIGSKACFSSFLRTHTTFRTWFLSRACFLSIVLSSLSHSFLPLSLSRLLSFFPITIFLPFFVSFLSLSQFLFLSHSSTYPILSFLSLSFNLILSSFYFPFFFPLYLMFSFYLTHISILSFLSLILSYLYLPSFPFLPLSVVFSYLTLSFLPSLSLTPLTFWRRRVRGPNSPRAALRWQSTSKISVNLCAQV